MDNILNPEEQEALAITVLKILDNWQVDPQHQVILLGLPEGTRPRALTRHRQGQALPNENEIMQRCQALLSIQSSLDTMFPHNTAMADYWVTTGNSQLGNKSPLQVMLENGLEGMRYVAGHLNNTEM
jgi:hypothetical protein